MRVVDVAPRLVALCQHLDEFLGHVIVSVTEPWKVASSDDD